MQLHPLGCNLVNVPSDQHGMIPAALKEVLSRWDPSEIHKPGSTAPKILYTIPNGGNPTGASMTAERKKEVYEVSRRQSHTQWDKYMHTLQILTLLSHGRTKQTSEACTLLITACCKAAFPADSLWRFLFKPLFSLIAGQAVRHAHHRGWPLLFPTVWKGAKTRDFFFKWQTAAC